MWRACHAPQAEHRAPVTKGSRELGPLPALGTFRGTTVRKRRAARNATKKVSGTKSQAIATATVSIFYQPSGGALSARAARFRTLIFRGFGSGAGSKAQSAGSIP